LILPPASDNAQFIWSVIVHRFPTPVLNGQCCKCRWVPNKKAQTPSNCQRFCRKIRWLNILNCSFSVVLKFVIFQYYVARHFLSTTSHLCTIRKHRIHWKCECSSNSPPAHLIGIFETYKWTTHTSLCIVSWHLKMCKKSFNLVLFCLSQDIQCFYCM